MNENRVTYKTRVSFVLNVYLLYTLLHIYAFSETRYLRATNYSRWDLTVSGFRRPSVFHDSVKLITTVLYLKRYDNTIRPQQYVTTITYNGPNNLYEKFRRKRSTELLENAAAYIPHMTPLPIGLWTYSVILRRVLWCGSDIHRYFMYTKAISVHTYSYA